MDQAQDFSHPPTTPGRAFGLISMNQLLTLGGTALVAILLAAKLHSGLGAFLFVVTAVIGLTLAFYQVDDSPLSEQIKLFVVFGLDELLGSHIWKASFKEVALYPGQVVPKCVGDWELLGFTFAIGSQEGVMGVAHDRGDRTYTAVVRFVTDRSFTLMSESRRLQILQAYNNFLASTGLPTSPVHRVTWVERLVSDNGEAIRRSHDLMRADANPDSMATNDAVLAKVGTHALLHEVLFALTITERSAGKAMRSRAKQGHMTRDYAACAVLADQIQDMAAKLTEIQGRAIVLTPHDMALDLVISMDPYARNRYLELQESMRRQNDVQPVQPWPLATQAAWSWFSTGPACHRTYVVAEGPSCPLDSTHLASVLGPPVGAPRSVSCVFYVPTKREARELTRRFSTDDGVGEIIQRRIGQDITTEQNDQRDATRYHQANVDRGGALRRWLMFATVSARTPEELDEPCETMLEHFFGAGFHLKGAYGHQDSAFFATQPITAAHAL